MNVDNQNQALLKSCILNRKHFKFNLVWTHKCKETKDKIIFVVDPKGENKNNDKGSPDPHRCRTVASKGERDGMWRPWWFTLLCRVVVRPTYQSIQRHGICFEYIKKWRPEDDHTHMLRQIAM